MPDELSRRPIISSDAGCHETGTVPRNPSDPGRQTHEIPWKQCCWQDLMDLYIPSNAAASWRSPAANEGWN